MYEKDYFNEQSDLFPRFERLSSPWLRTEKKRLGRSTIQVDKPLVPTCNGKSKRWLPFSRWSARRREKSHADKEKIAVPRPRTRSNGRNPSDSRLDLLLVASY